MRRGAPLPKAKLKPAFEKHAPMPEVQRVHKRPAPLSLRLSAAERLRLERLAAGQSLGGYIRERIFLKSASDPMRGDHSIADKKLLAQVLRALGEADTLRTVGDLRTAFDDGALSLSEDAEWALIQACVDIAEMRRALLGALGFKVGHPS